MTDTAQEVESYPSRATLEKLVRRGRDRQFEELGYSVWAWNGVCSDYEDCGLTPELPTVANPEHVELAQRVHELLDRAGLLVPVTS
jgi:hypothetical protein